MAFHLHPNLSTYPGASFQPPFTGPHLAFQSGGNSLGYWGHIPPEPSPLMRGELPQLGLPPAITAMMEGRGTGMYGVSVEGRGLPFNYGWPKYGPVSSDLFIIFSHREWLDLLAETYG